MTVFARARKIAEWDFVAKFGQNHFLSSSCLWLLLVPVACRAVSGVESPLKFAGLGEIELELPFSWKLFYISALFVFIGKSIYFLFCPRIVKDFRDYGDFKKSGRDCAYLSDYRKQEACDHKQEQMNRVIDIFSRNDGQDFGDSFKEFIEDPIAFEAPIIQI